MDTGERIRELEASVASLSKQNTKLKNELKFTTETERWAGHVGVLCLAHFLFVSAKRRASGEYIASLQREIESVRSRNEKVIFYCFIVP